MENALKNLFAVSDLRNRVLFTLALLGVYRVGSHVPTPGVNQEALRLFADQLAGSMFGLANMFTGGSLSRVTIFALGVMPYISASIIIQLLTVVWPYLERISKEGELGRRKITQYTRYLTVVLAVVQSFGYAIWLESSANAPGGLPLVFSPGWGFRLMCVLTLTTGTMFVMWLGEQITERGIGNGMSLLIFAGIVVNFPTALLSTLDQMQTGQIGPLRIIFLIAMAVVVIGAIIFVERAFATDHGPIRQTCRWPPAVRRLEHAHPVEGEHGRRHPGDLCVVHPVVLHDGRAAVRSGDVAASSHRSGCVWDAALQPAVRGGHHLLRVLLHVDHLQPR